MTELTGNHEVELSSGRTAQLTVIGVSVAVAALTVYLVGATLDVPLVRFVGLMVAATTFVPLPADTFVLAASAGSSPLALGLVGGAVNGVMVVVERRWLLHLVDHPWFDRFAPLFETNRFVAFTERNMFLALVVGGASFLPFEPFRLIAVVRDYSPVKYVLATTVARGGRYYIVASAGTVLFEVGLLQQAIWITLALFAVGLWQTGVKVASTADDVDLELALELSDG